MGFLGLARDVTDRVRAQEELTRHREDLEELVRQRTMALEQRNAELRAEVEDRIRLEARRRELSTIVERSRDLVAIANAAGSVEYMNPAGLRLVGLEDLDAVQERSFHDFMVQEELPDVLGQLLPRIASKGHGRGEGKLRNLATGSAFDVSFEVFTLPPDKDGSPPKLATITRDITARKRAEAELREREAFLTAIVDNLPLMLMVKEAVDLRLVRVNAFAARQLGSKPEELIGARARDHLPPETAARLDAADRAVLAGGRPVEEPNLVFRAPTGQRIVHSRKVPILDEAGAPRYLLTLAEDVTELRKEEARLRSLSEAVEHSPVAVSISDVDGVIEYVNPQFSQLTGYTREEALGSDHSLLKSGQTPDEVYQQLWSTVLDGRPWQGHICNRRKDSSLYWEQVSIAPVRGKNGAITHFVALKRDITDQLRASEELALARDSAEQANRAKSAFLATMSHEIRTPMNAIIGMGHLLQRTPLTTVQSEYVEIVQSASRRLLALVNDVLDFSKIEAEGLELEHKPFLLDDLLEEVVSLSAVVAEGKGLELLLLRHPEVPNALVGDSLRLGQVLTNLVSNAVKFTDRGHVALEVHREGDAASGLLLRFEVRDTGIGIPAEKQAGIFEPFVQADGSTTRRYGGTGLGLAISRRLLEAMDGRLELQSEEGGGTTFAALVPLQHAAGERWQRPSVPIEARGLTVLLVAASPLARVALVTSLRAWGLDPVEADGTTAAVGCARSLVTGGARAGLVLLDWKTAGADLVDLRQEPALKGAPVVVLAPPGEISHAAAALGDTDSSLAISHPTTPTRLLAAVHRALGLEAGDAAEPAPRSRVVGTPSRLRGARVLLVEDVAANRRVAVTLLHGAGIEVDEATHGEEALELLRTETTRRYDAVLMDLQMPGMDGFEATRRIRGTPSTDRVPIIALTADTLAAVQERCLAAGFDDWLGKPFDPADLTHVLEKWIGRPAHVPAPAAPLPEQASDLPGLDLGAGLRYLGGDQAFFVAMLREFTTEFAHFPEAVQAALAQEDGTEVRALAHKITGVAATLGATGVVEAARQLAEAGEAAGPELERAMREALGQVEEATKVLGSGRGRSSSLDGATQPTGDSLPGLVKELAARLKASDIEARRVGSQLERAVAGRAVERRLRPLFDLVRSYDFDAASQLLASFDWEQASETDPSPASPSGPLNLTEAS